MTWVFLPQPRWKVGPTATAAMPAVAACLCGATATMGMASPLCDVPGMSRHLHLEADGPDRSSIRGKTFPRKRATPDHRHASWPPASTALAPNRTEQAPMQNVPRTPISRAQHPPE